MLVSGHLQSGYKQNVLRGRNWRSLGMGARGWRTQGFGARPGQTLTPGTTASTSGTTTTSGPSGGGTNARIAALASRPPYVPGQKTGIPPSNRPGQTTSTQAANTTTNQNTFQTALTCPVGTQLDFFGASCIPVSGATTNGGTTVLPVATTGTGPTPLEWGLMAGGAVLLILLASKK